ncbi:hypothetical protein PG991_001766 [Apiospora marii]|uniref:C2H2-type domain-containing protein n=1 Tax=Apiospora marii TaxID=335849 RepID=A0ABR1SMX6_9PEZI
MPPHDADQVAPLTGISSGPLSDEERKSLALRYYNDHLSQPGNDKPFVAKETLAERDRIWNRWNKYCEEVEVDSRTTWLSFAQTPNAPETQAHFVTFLKIYVEDSTQKRVVLGPEECQWKRTVTSAFPLMEVWRRLVAAAEYHVMKKEREAAPSEAGTWALRWICKDEGAREGPTYIIVKLIFMNIAVELDLDTDTSYLKVAMTSVDVDVVLKSLWSRADIIRCKPETRVSFHSVILLAAIGGFRRGTLLDLKFNQFDVAVVRDPANPTRTKIVMTVFIKRNKIKETSKTSRARNGGWIGFSITLVPNSTFCLGSQILTRGIQKKAFKVDFKTIDEIFELPNLESVDFVPLEWKQEMMEEMIFSISSNKLNELWHSVLLAAGFRKDPRLYALRVGTGTNLDGVLSDAMRNYVMSHTTNVFESNYQTSRSRAQLMKLAFGAEAGNHDPLFQRLNDISLSRDPGAPTEVTADEKQVFEERQDVRAQRSELRAARDRTTKHAIRNKLNYLLKTLSQLKLEEKRAAYFERVDLLRAQGQRTTDDSKVMGLSGDLPPAIARVSQLLQTPSKQCTAEYEVDLRRFMSALLAYLNNAHVISDDNDPKAEAEVPGQHSRCLFCEKPFADRSSLTRHTKNQHTKDTTFSRPFTCPKCDEQVDGAEQWSNHVERVHGRANAPNWKREDGQHVCCLCGLGFKTEPRLVAHMNRHVQDGASGWPCQGRICTVLFQNKREWLEHCQACHLPSSQVCDLCDHICSTASGLTRHLSATHAADFRKPFPKHVMMAHHGGAETYGAHGVHVGADRQDRIVTDSVPTPPDSVMDQAERLSASCLRKRSWSDVDPDLEDENEGEDGPDDPDCPSPDGVSPVSERAIAGAELPPVPIELIDPALVQEGLQTPIATTEASSPPTSYDGSAMDVEEHQDGSQDPPSYKIDCILERWKKNTFLIQWEADRSYWWVPRKDILDEEMVREFETSYQGYHRGVEVLGKKRQGGKMRYRLRWTGRPAAEDTWVDEKDLSPELRSLQRPCQPKPRKRRCC